ncbi:polysaccharide biosynthesis/export family protein [Planctomycetes bacterium K23_9]|uniref:Polysaccharide biosynthesis/export protein n=1 Tax=Stieleria marina TaxID=1930275 RepID=A0A517NXK8_9BACT|nr:Polysaccharide biosynthesis/export protein [Planctomycetes bacterium K23_9]
MRILHLSLLAGVCLLSVGDWSFAADWSEYQTLSNRITDLTDEYTRLSNQSPERANTKKSIEAAVAEAFDLRQKIQREEIVAARKELDAIEQRLNERQQDKAQILQNKVTEILSGKELAWPISEGREKAKTESGRIAAGDVIAIYLPGVLPFNPPNQPPTPPPVTNFDSGLVATGYPIVVHTDGTVQLPLIDRIQVAGLSIREAEKAVANAYVETDILRPEKARPMITLIPKHGSN